MPRNNRSHRPEAETPPVSSVQDYLARKYASLGIRPPEPNGHQPVHIPATFSDRRSEVAPKPSAGDERSDLANSPPEAGSRKPEADSATSSPDSVSNPTPPELAPKPFTRDQRNALDLLERGKTVTEIMDTLGFSRKTFYDWRDANPIFATAVQRSRDERRGVIVDAVEDIQLAGLTLIDNYIRSDHASDSIRLRAVGLIFRYGNTENFLPRRLVANFTGPDGLTPINQNPQAGPTAPSPSGEPSDPTNSTDGLPSDLAPSEGEQQSDLANASLEAGNRNPEAGAAPSHTERTAESVRSVRFENPQSTTLLPCDERGEVAPAPSEQRSDLPNMACDERSNVANLPPDPGPASSSLSAKPRETTLANAFLSATFLHKHEPREAFERLLKHQLRAYAPATPQEDLLTFRITQKSWILRRLDTLDRVIADSAVTKVREKHPNAAPAACIATTYLERNDTEETRFYERIAAQRKDHEAALDRLEARLQTLQTRREAKEDRRESREDRHRKPVQQTALPATPKALQRAAA